MGYPSGKELSLSPASCRHVPVPPSPPENLYWPQVLVGWKSATSPSLSLALPCVLCCQPSPCGIFFMASDAMPRREEASGRRCESWVLLSWCQFVASLIFFQAALSGTACPKCLCAPEVELGFSAPLQHLANANTCIAHILWATPVCQECIMVCKSLFALCTA